MLLKAHPLILRAITAIGLALTVSTAQAQEAHAGESTALPYLDATDPATLEAAKAAGSAMVRDILSAYETLKTPEMEQSVRQFKRKFDDIADETLAKERNKILEFLGLDPESETGLYYFVSWSMPLELLRSYAIEAMWSGGTVVLKGVPPGKDLGRFIVDDLRQLVYGKGSAANISIDPRLFDAYQVQTVPAIVFTTSKADMQCLGVNPVPVKVGEVSASYDTCPELDPATYWKISGAVTTSYALDLFADNGAEQAKLYAKALAKGFLNGTKPSRDQQLFTGKWEDAISPSELLAAQEAAGLATKQTAVP